jgi:hypothetical protein
MTIFEKKVLKKLDEILEKLNKPILTNDQAEELIAGKELELEDYNFKVNSDRWNKIKINKTRYLENPEKDIWEFVSGKYIGEQLFTWDAAMRETKKAGKKIPTNDEVSILLKTKEDMKNIAFSGYRNTDGSFAPRSTYAYIWSSSQSGDSAWHRLLGSSFARVYRATKSKADGFSVRCLK